MGGKRDEFSSGVVRLLRDRVGGLCSNPDCKQATVGPSRERGDRSVIIGQAAHIRAAAQGGARFDPSQSHEERSSIENGIWLCSNCAALVDKNLGSDFPVKVLQEWKRMAESQAAKAQTQPKTFREENWQGEFSHFTYLNIPRLAMWAGLGGYRIDLSFLEGVSCLHELGFSLVRVMSEFEELIRELSIQAVQLDRVAESREDFTGVTASFDGTFYTKNGPSISSDGHLSQVPTDWNNAPHIYRKIKGLKFAVVYDPRWVTTSTAYVEFRGGRRRFKGIGIVKEVNREDCYSIISPLIIGHPKPDFDWL
jgi:hypothetical protein